MSIINLFRGGSEGQEPCDNGMCRILANKGVDPERAKVYVQRMVEEGECPPQLAPLVLEAINQCYALYSLVQQVGNPDPSYGIFTGKSGVALELARRCCEFARNNGCPYAPLLNQILEEY